MELFQIFWFKRAVLGGGRTVTGLRKEEAMSIDGKGNSRFTRKLLFSVFLPADVSDERKKGVGSDRFSVIQRRLR